MFSENSLGAYLYLQERASYQTDIFALERFDRALDEIVKNPQRQQPAAFQSRSALANAGKVIKARRALAPVASIDATLEAGREIGSGTSAGASGSTVGTAFEAVETAAWLAASPRVTEIQRSLLLCLANGHDAESLAERHGVPVARMRERIARARAAARRAYAAEVLHESVPTPRHTASASQRSAISVPA